MASAKRARPEGGTCTSRRSGATLSMQPVGAFGCSSGNGKDVVESPRTVTEIEAFGKPVAVVLQDDGVPHVFYEDGSELAFHPIAVA